MNNEFDDLRDFALAAFLNGYGCPQLMQLDAKVVEAVGAEAGLDVPRTRRVLEMINETYSKMRDARVAWLKRNAN